MSETCQKLVFTHPVVVLKSGLKNNWMKKLDRVSRPLSHLNQAVSIVRTLRKDQSLRLLLNLLFYHFICSVPTYKSQRIKLPDVIAACNQLNVNALN